MLSHYVITRGNSIQKTVEYYSADDGYYVKDGVPSAWQGKGAKGLKLSGKVDKEVFQRLLDGRIGRRKLRTATRHDQKERLALDLVIQLPKSASIAYLVGGDTKILAAHERSVTRTIERIEREARARQKVMGKTNVEVTGNLIVAKFTHEMSREQDPHLHTHCVVMNLTKRKDGQWRALTNDEILKNSIYFGAVYRAELAMELNSIGYALRLDHGGSYELAHISREQILAFSQRSTQIKDHLAKQGLTRDTATFKQKQFANFATRAPKDESNRAEIHAGWVAKAKALGIDFRREKTKNPPELLLTILHAPAQEAAKRSVTYAVNSLTERQSIITEKELVTTALEHGTGSTTAGYIDAAIAAMTREGSLVREATTYHPADEPKFPPRTQAAWEADLIERGFDSDTASARVSNAISAGGLVPSDTRYTTKRAIDRERRILAIEREGRGAMRPITSSKTVQAKLENKSLNDEQKAAVELMATTTNSVVGVQGWAGVGKSHMLDAAKTLIESQGYEFRAVAPNTTQVQELRKLGVESKTLQGFLMAKKKTLTDKTVLVIDEAGLVSSRQMRQVLGIAKKAGARVVMTGDKAQIKAVEAGKPFDQLQLHGMSYTGMTEIQRQQNPALKRGVEYAAEGNSMRSLAHIRTIIPIADAPQRYAEIANRFAALTPEEREETLIVSGTNEARREINRLVRNRIGTEGKGIEYKTLVRRDMTSFDLKYANNYAEGDLIQPERDYPNAPLMRDTLYRVVGTGPNNKLTVEAVSKPQGHIQFSPSVSSKLSVYENQKQELAPGDKVRITRNDKPLNLANGNRFTVEKVSKNTVHLTDGKRTVELDASKPLHVDLAYATTAHSSQGMTVDRTFLDIDTKSRTTAKDTYYVGVSRARHNVVIFTDDLSKLPEAISRENAKHSALELVRSDNPQKKTGPTPLARSVEHQFERAA